jgi:hypothetical protein
MIKPPLKEQLMQLPGADTRNRAEELGGRPQRRVECSEGT